MAKAFFFFFFFFFYSGGGLDGCGCGSGWVL